MGAVDEISKKPSGFGIGIEKEGTLVFEGQFKDGLPHGKGRQYSYHTIYDGDWEAGLEHGFGIQYSKHQTYKGEFL